MRDISKSEKIHKIAYDKKLPIEVGQLDVTSENSVDAAISAIVEQEGQIDVLVNNAGYGLMGPAEELTIDELRDQFETNVFGVLRTTKKVLPIMRRNQHGTIINLSSIVGKVGIPIMSGYVSSKFALEGLMESMRYELEPFGIRVVLVEPGVIKTNFLNSSVFAKKALEQTSPYRTLIQKMGEGFDSKFESGASPIEVANVILQAATSTNPEIRYSVGSDAELLLDARRKMSDADFETFLKLNFLGEKKILQEKGGEM
jgi:NAD(P)-dependent dehydrogenase (short-subunit alcohol dehydrogenase family)